MSIGFDLNADDGVWTVGVSTADEYGFFERNKDGSGGGLWFDRGDDDRLELTDYDGVYELPRRVADILRAWDIYVDASFD